MKDIHFGIKLSSKEGGHKLTADNYIRNRDLQPNNLNKELRQQIESVMEIYYLNIAEFSTLSRSDFQETITAFVNRNNFREIYHLDEAEDIAGHYMMVLDEYCQIYIGTSTSSKNGLIKGRIKSHWNNNLPIDKLESRYCGSLKIGSFRTQDTTRIFIRPDNEWEFNYNDYTQNEKLEGKLVAQIPLDYCLNQAIINLPIEEAKKMLLHRDERDYRVYGNKAEFLNYPTLAEKFFKNRM